jgi:hypothetical protein
LDSDNSDSDVEVSEFCTNAREENVEMLCSALALQVNLSFKSVVFKAMVMNSYFFDPDFMVLNS